MNDLTAFVRLANGKRVVVHEDRANGPRAVLVRVSDGTERRFANEDLASIYIDKLERAASSPIKTKIGA